MASSHTNITCFRTQLPGEVIDDIYYFPVVESTTTTGKKTTWQITVKPVSESNEHLEITDEMLDNKPLPGDIFAQIEVISGHVGGKTRDVVPTIVRKGKSVGKKNATNVFCQALRDANSEYKKKLKKTASHTHGVVKRYPPMLADIYKGALPEDAMVQRKYNGVRCVATLESNDSNAESVPVDDNHVLLYSRTGEAYHGFDDIKEELKPILQSYYKSHGELLYLDGELYKHGMALQEISGIARKISSRGAVTLEYMNYGAFVPSKPKLTARERYNILKELYAERPADAESHVHLVDSYAAKSREQLQQCYDTFIEEGYEGAMIYANTPYIYSYNSHHSKSLLKLKPSFDGEFKLIGFGKGSKGKSAESLMLKCCTTSGKEFNVTPALEIAIREDLYKKLSAVQHDGETLFDKKYAGRMLVVTYDELGKDKETPQRARTSMLFRDMDTMEHYTVNPDEL